MFLFGVLVLKCKMSRVITAVKPHVPLIKFPVRTKWIPKLKEVETSVNVSAPNPSTSIQSTPVLHTPIAPDTIEVFRVVPERFRRRPVSIEELEYIQRGGPE